MKNSNKNTPVFIRADTDKNDLHRTLETSSLQRMEGEGNERKFTLSFSSEEPYERWFGIEILDHSEQAVDLKRINEIGCLLFNHNRDAVIGKINRAWLENGRGCAVVTLFGMLTLLIGISLNASQPMEITPSGMTTLTSELLYFFNTPA